MDFGLLVVMVMVVCVCVWERQTDRQTEEVFWVAKIKSLTILALFETDYERILLSK